MQCYKYMRDNLPTGTVNHNMVYETINRLWVLDGRMVIYLARIIEEFIQNMDMNAPQNVFHIFKPIDFEFLVLVASLIIARMKSGWKSEYIKFMSQDEDYFDGPPGFFNSLVRHNILDVTICLAYFSLFLQKTDTVVLTCAEANLEKTMEHIRNEWALKMSNTPEKPEPPLPSLPLKFADHPKPNASAKLQKFFAEAQQWSLSLISRTKRKFGFSQRKKNKNGESNN